MEDYNVNTENFVHGTVNVDFQEIQEGFLKYILPQGRIPDFGCGSGRDAKYFDARGFEVDVVDGLKELCRLVSEYTGLPVIQMLFRILM